jgi:hypothetical protein
MAIHDSPEILSLTDYAAKNLRIPTLDSRNKVFLRFINHQYPGQFRLALKDPEVLRSEPIIGWAHAFGRRIEYAKAYPNEQLLTTLLRSENNPYTYGMGNFRKQLSSRLTPKHIGQWKMRLSQILSNATDTDVYIQEQTTLPNEDKGSLVGWFVEGQERGVYVFKGDISKNNTWGVISVDGDIDKLLVYGLTRFAAEEYAKNRINEIASKIKKRVKKVEVKIRQGQYPLTTAFNSPKRFAQISLVQGHDGRYYISIATLDTAIIKTKPFGDKQTAEKTYHALSNFEEIRQLMQRFGVTGNSQNVRL